MHTHICRGPLGDPRRRTKLFFDWSGDYIGLMRELKDRMYIYIYTYKCMSCVCIYIYIYICIPIRSGDQSDLVRELRDHQGGWGTVGMFLCSQTSFG